MNQPSSPSVEPVIEIIVSPTGQVRITTRGYSGASCKDATRELEAALGEVQSDQPTAEMYQTSAAKLSQQLDSR